MFDNYYTKYEERDCEITLLNAKEGIKKLERKLKKENREDIYAHLSKAYIFVQKYESALTYALEAINKNPNYGYAHIRAAYAYGKLNQKAKSLEHIEIAKQLSNNDYLISLISILIFESLKEKEKLQKEIEIYKKFEEKDNNYYDTFLMRIYQIENNKLEVEKIFKRIEKRDKAYALKKRADVIAQSGNKEDLSIWIEKALEYDNNDAYLYYLKGWMYKEEQEYNLAIENFLKAKSLGLEYFYLYKDLAYCLSCEKEYEKSNEYIEKGIKENPKTGYFYYLKGFNYYKQKDYLKAIEYFIKAEALNYTDINIYEKTLKKIEDYKIALQYSQKLYDLNKDEDAFYKRDGDIYENKKLYEEAEECYLKAEKIKEQDYYFYVRLSHFNSQLKRYEKSIAYAEKAIEIEPSGYCYSHIACVYEDMGEYKKALENFLTAEKLGFKEEYIYTKIAYLYCCPIFGDYEKSNEYIDLALKTNPQNGYLLYLKGFNYCALEKYEDALYWLKKSFKQGFREDYIYEEFAKVYLYKDEKDTKKALKYIDEGLKTSKNKDYLYSLKGYIYKKSDDYDKALHYFLKVKDYPINEVWYISELAHLYTFFQKGREKETIKYINKLSKNENNSAYSHYLKFCFHIEHKKFRKAENDIKVFLEKYKDTCHHNCCLADIYLSLQEYEKAKKYVAKALEQKQDYAFNKIKSSIYVQQIIIENELGNKDVALDLYNINKEKLDNKNQAVISSYLINIFLEKQDFQNAKLFLKNTKNSKYYNITSGNYYFAKKDFNKAKKYYILAENENTINKEVIENLITIYQSKNNEKAVTEYKEKLAKLIKEEKLLEKLRKKF